jgi:peptidoglycan hydrolase-like protein with peptidoglycan-binding domain
MYRKTIILVTAIAISLLPAVAFAQYGGGGLIGGPFSVGYVNANPQPNSNATGNANTASGGKVLGASVYNFTVNLRYGDTGVDVTALQGILIADGDLHISAPTGWFGPLTFAAVKEYQAANGVPATGFVGPLTRAVLNKGNVPNVSMSDAKENLADKLVGTIENLWGDWQATRAR